MKFNQTLRYCIQQSNVNYYINTIIQQDAHNNASLNSLCIYITSNKCNDNTSGYHYLSPSQLIKTLSMCIDNSSEVVTCVDTRIRTACSSSSVNQVDDKLEIIVGYKNGIISIFEENIAELLSSNTTTNDNNIQSSKSYVVTRLQGEVTWIKYFGDRYIFASSITSNESILLVETDNISLSHHSLVRLEIDYEFSVPVLDQRNSEDTTVPHIVPTTISVLKLTAVAKSSEDFHHITIALQVLKLYFPSVVFDAIQYISNEDMLATAAASTARYLVLVGDSIGNVWWFLTPIYEYIAICNLKNSVTTTEYLTWTAQKLDSVGTVTKISSIHFIIQPHSNCYGETLYHYASIDDAMKPIHKNECSITLNVLYGIAIFEIDGYCTFLGCRHNDSFAIENAIHYSACHHRVRFPGKIVMNNIQQCSGILIYQDDQGILYANTIYELVGTMDSPSIKTNNKKIIREVLDDCNYIIRLDEKIECVVHPKQLTSSISDGTRWFIDFKFCLNLNNNDHSNSISNTAITSIIELVCLDNLQQYEMNPPPPHLLLISIAVEQQRQEKFCATSDYIITCLQNNLDHRLRRHPHNIIPLTNCYSDHRKHIVTHHEDKPFKVQYQNHNAHLINEIQICQQNKVDDLRKLNELDEELLRISSTLAEYEHLTTSYQHLDSFHNITSSNNLNIKLVYKFRREVSNYQECDITDSNLTYLDIHIASLSIATMRALFQKHLIVSFGTISVLTSPSFSGSSYAVSIPIQWKRLEQPFEIMQEMASLGLLLLLQPNKSGNKKTTYHPPIGSVEPIYTFDCSIPIKIDKFDFHLLSISLINENSNVKFEQEANFSCGSVIFLLNKVLSMQELLPSYPPSFDNVLNQSIPSKDSSFQAKQYNNDSSFQAKQYKYTVSLNIPNVTSSHDDAEGHYVDKSNASSLPIKHDRLAKVRNILRQSFMKSICIMSHMNMQSSFTSKHSSSNNDRMRSKFGDFANKHSVFNIGSNAKSSVNKITDHKKHKKISHLKRKKSLNLNIDTIVNNNSNLYEGKSSYEMRQNNQIGGYNLSSDSAEILAHMSAVSKLNMLYEIQFNNEICNSQEYSKLHVLDEIEIDEDKYHLIPTIPLNIDEDKYHLIPTIPLNIDFQQAMAQCAHIMRKYETICTQCKFNNSATNVIPMKDDSLIEYISSSNHISNYKCLCQCYQQPNNEDCYLDEELTKISEELWSTYCRIREC